MVTALFILALCSMAVMGLFLWWLTRRHRREEAERQARDPAPPSAGLE